MMKYAKLFLPFIVILIACSQALHGFASICASNVTPYNESLEGARIMLYKKEIENPASVKDVDILFAGTSRTMADYDPQVFAKTLAANVPLPYAPSARNLGNMANYPTLFEAYLKSGGLRPKLLIIEFSPHIFIREAEAQKPPDRFSEYRVNVKIQELFVEGWSAQIFGLEELGWISPSSLYALSKSRVTQSAACGAELDIFRLGAYGYGQKLKEGGQVAYRTYLPNRQASEKARSLIQTEYGMFESVYLVGSFNESEWEAYKRIISDADSQGSVVVVRPPLDPELYALENQQLPDVVNLVTEYLASNGIPYVDMNSHNYYSLDMSHVDWYDTPKLSEDLALKIIPLADWRSLLKK